MRKARPIALVAAGPVSKSYLSDLPAIADRLGPVKAISPRVASRIANRLRAGRPVARYEDFEDSTLVLVWIENAARLSETVREMASSGLSWRGRAVVLCHDLLDSEELSLLSERGAWVASLCALEGYEPRRLVAEGDREALRQLRAAFGVSGRRIIILRRGSKDLFLAGLSLAASFTAPLASSSAACFGASGMSAPVAQSVLEDAMLRSLQAYRKAGKRGWTGPLAKSERKSILRQVEAVRKWNPASGERFCTIVTLALEALGRESGWLKRYQMERDWKVRISGCAVAGEGRS